MVGSSLAHLLKIEKLLVYSYSYIAISQYVHVVVLTSMRRRFNVMDVVWTSKRRRRPYGDNLHLQLRFSIFRTYHEG